MGNMEESKGKTDFNPGFWLLLQWWPLVLLSVCIPTLAATENTRIEVLLSSEASYYQQVVNGLTDALLQQHPDADISTVSLREFSERDEPDSSTGLVIAIGTSASKVAMQKNGHFALLCTFLPRSAYLALLTQHQGQLGSRPVSAIFLDQPISRYMALIKTLVPKATQLGTAVGPVSSQLLPDMRSLAQQQEMELHYVELDENTNPVATLAPLVETSDVFLATPDQAGLNRVIAKWLLYLSIRQRIPVIGFSLAYVNAGALAAVYSSPQDIGRDTGETASRWLSHSNSSLQPARYPAYFSLRTNPSVARALGIQLPSEVELYMRVSKESTNLQTRGGGP